MNAIAPGISRIDGPAKVTGRAKYAGDYAAKDLLYGYIAGAMIAKGRIASIDTRAALAFPGVVHVFTHENMPRLASMDRSYKDQLAPDGRPLRLLRDAEIAFSGEPVALVVAETRQAAVHGAELLEIVYDRRDPATDLEAERPNSFEDPDSRGGMGSPPEPRGDAGKALVEAAASTQQRYTTPAQHHNPMEPFAATAVWQKDGSLTVYDKTQGVQNCQKYLAKIFGMGGKDLQVVSPFVGGAFGAGLRPQPSAFFAVLAARELKRNVQVTMDRKQMFTLGFRSSTIQDLQLGATAEGKLTAVTHDVLSSTSSFENYVETIVDWSGGTYACDNARLGYRLAKLNVNTPCDMRAPGATQGMYAFESAIDELAWKLGADPLQFRIANHAATDPNEDRSYSSKQLLECYRQGSERFGWVGRSLACRASRKGSVLTGQGMATGVWEAMHMPCSAKAVFQQDGRLTVSAATSDIGTGTYTIMAMIAANTLGVPLDRVTAELGDSRLPMAPVQGGSFTAASVGTAVQKACLKLRTYLVKLARSQAAFHGGKDEDFVFEGGAVFLRSDPARMLPLTELMRLTKTRQISRKAIALPALLKRRKFTSQAHSAVFAEVEVDDDFGTVHVTRVVAAVAAGKILNEKTARSQILGGVVWGISMALHEESVMDHAQGRFMNHDFASYHIPVNADIGEIEVIFVEEEDSVVNPLGVKGVGEIGIVGTAAAVANAVFHATGKRVRELPITPDKLL